MFPLDTVLNVGMKTCSVCAEEKQTQEFRFRTDTNKLRSFCLKCESGIRHTTYLATKPYRLNKAQKDRESDPVKKILKQAKQTAISKKLEFNITEEDIVIPEICKYLGIPLTNIQGQGVVWSNCSIDRIDSSKGYIKGNVEIISRKANTMKTMATKEELVVFAKNVLKIHGE